MKSGVVSILLFLLLALLCGLTEASQDNEELSAPPPASPSKWGRQEELSAWSKEVLALYQAARYPEAVAAAESLAADCEKRLPSYHPCTLAAVRNLAGLYLAAAEYARARDAYTRAYRIADSLYGPRHEKTLALRERIAQIVGLQTNMAAFQMALEQYCLDSAQYPTTEQGLLALVKKPAIEPVPRSWSPYIEKIPRDPWGNEYLYEAAPGGITYKITSPGPREPVTAWTFPCSEGEVDPSRLRALGERDSLRDELKRLVSGVQYEKAIPVAFKMFELTRDLFGKKHPDTGTALLNLADTYKEMQDYAGAEPLYKECLSIYLETLGGEHILVAMALNKQAGLYAALGDFEESEALFKRSLGICERLQGPEALAIKGAVLNNMFLLYGSLGEPAKAEPLLRRALDLYVLLAGLENPDTLSIRENLALCYSAMGRHSEAETLFKEVLAVKEKSPGQAGFMPGLTWNNLGSLYLKAGDPEKAVSSFKRALPLQENLFGRDHQATAMVAHNLAFGLLDSGSLSGARSAAGEVSEVEERVLANVLSFASEEQALKYQATTNPYSLLVSLGMIPELAQAALRHKGIILDSLVEDRQIAEKSQDPSLRDLVVELQVARRKMQQELLGSAAPGNKQSDLEALRKGIAELERALARHITGLGRARRALSVTLRQVQAVVPEGEILIEFLLYKHYLGKSNLEPHYGAILIPGDRNPTWVPLGKAEEIDQLMGKMRSTLLEYRSERRDERAADLLRALYEKIWGPIEKDLPRGTKGVILSPDGLLNFLSFATLLTPDNRFLAENYLIRYVSSGRDLLKEAPEATASRMVLFGSPDFRMSEAMGKEITPLKRLPSSRELERIGFAPLPGTHEECLDLEKMAKSWGWEVNRFMGKDANEGQLQNIGSPRILHLATHGFFLKESRPLSSIFPGGRNTGLESFPNPMYRSGIALARAQTTIEAWKAGIVPPPENDGIVTAEEVGALPLSQTWLVTLSACDTGIGEARTGEGVLGLRRGFVQAGARNLLFTLWPVADEETVLIMHSFYARAHEISDLSRALAEVQQTYLVKWRKEKGLARAASLAGPFVLSLQGRP